MTPLSGSDLGPKITPVFYFNQPMDRASVESALQSQPAFPVRYEWIDDSTLRLVPEQPLSLEKDLALMITSRAKAENGSNLVAPIQVIYRAPEKLRVVERLPRPNSVDVNPSSAVAITFNRPIVALGAEMASAPAPFQVERAGGNPSPSGRGEWLNTSTYIFYPQPALFGGTQYTVKLNPTLNAFDGTPFPDDQGGQEWTFTTSTPAILSLEPGTERPVSLDDNFRLTFNQAMDAASVENNFNLVGPDGNPVVGTLTWNETSTQVTFTPDTQLERDTAYSIVLSGAALTRAGRPWARILPLRSRPYLSLASPDQPGSR